MSQIIILADSVQVLHSCVIEAKSAGTKRTR